MNTLMAFCLLCGLACMCVGAARLVAWFLDRREAEAARVIHEASLIARARTEVRHG